MELSKEPSKKPIILTESISTEPSKKPIILTESISTEPTEPIYKCDMCNTILSSKRNLEWHIYNKCQFKHSCHKCNLTFTTNNYLIRHKKLCIGLLQCQKCSKILSRKQTYLNHIYKCK